MEEKERVDALMKLAEFHMQHRKERREIEWRISPAIWGFLAAGIVTTASNSEFRKAITAHPFTVCGLLIGAIFFTGYGSLPIWRATCGIATAHTHA